MSEIQCLVVNVVVIKVKGLVHCFSMRVVMKKWFFQNPEKKFDADPSCRFREKRNKCTL